jgi:hypothetical protein
VAAGQASGEGGLAGRVDAVHLKDRYGEIESKTRAPIAGIVRVPMVMEVHPSVPAKTVLPDVPAPGETLPGYEASAWFGLGGPRRTPEEVVEN